MLEKYMEEQSLVTTVLKKSLKNDKLVQAYLFSSDDIDYIYKYADEIREKLRKLKNNKNNYKKYNKIELLLICSFPIIYKTFLKIFDIFIRNRRQR